MFKDRITAIESALPIIIGIAFLVNLIAIIVVQVGANTQGIQTIALIVVSGASLFSTWWLSQNSPQAVAAAIQKKRHIDHQRQLYYKKINDNIIERLSKLNAIPGSLSYSPNSFHHLHVLYGLRQIKENPLYSRAIDQLDSDYPGFSDDIDRIDTEVNQHNASVDHYISKTKEAIIEELSEIGHLEVDHEKMANGGIREGFVMDLIFEQVDETSNKVAVRYGNYNQGVLQTAISQIPPLDFRIGKDDNLWLDERLTATEVRGDGNKKIMEIIEKYRHDTSIIEEFIRFKKRQLIFEVKTKELANKCKMISSLIDMGEYYTITNHCKDNRFI
jgi:hypothetical protein